MKKDRNCGMGVYPGMMPDYGGMIMPGGVIPMPGVMNYPNSNFGNIPNGSTTTLNNYGSQDLSSITNQINTLEKRVSRLESLVNNGSYSSNYNSSNYQMM